MMSYKDEFIQAVKTKFSDETRKNINRETVAKQIRMYFRDLQSKLKSEIIYSSFDMNMTEEGYLLDVEITVGNQILSIKEDKDGFTVTDSRLKIDFIYYKTFRMFSEVHKTEFTTELLDLYLKEIFEDKLN
ncbi:hypothetical protein [Evansella tamaricis]|uniref:Uncharacterized protein n=1 Tax=Evansella tamaricis TaxID=2069301 RepID=A0ABS6JL90_9BACI|nr:hypothetical protein [Evansella tamaricis]MBU9714434.1 hypothetical protein [Evansella tamaricis]